jgi:hypothetical protein
MVMQRAALVAGVGGIVLMLAVSRMDVVMMIMRDMTSFGHVRSHILLRRKSVFEMQADERHDTACLGQKKEPEQPRSNSSSGSTRDHSSAHPSKFVPNPQC